MSKYTYESVHNKLIKWECLIGQHTKCNWSFQKMADHYGVSQKRMRTEYANALKVQEWDKHSTLWSLICKHCMLEPASHAVRLYGILRTNGVSTVSDLLEHRLDKLASFKGIGPKYLKTLSKARAEAINMIDKTKVK